MSEQLQSSPSIPVSYLLTDQFDKQIAQGNVICITDANIPTYGFSPFVIGSDSIYVIDLSVAQPLNGDATLNNIQSLQWLSIQLLMSQSHQQAILYGYVKISIISSLASNFIIYQSNEGFEYYHIESNSVPGQLLSLSIINTINSSTPYLSVSDLPGEVYPVYLTVQSSVNYS